MADCWEANLKPDLSQGDLLSLVLVGTASHPKTALMRGATRKGGAQAWEHSPAWKPILGNGRGYFLAEGVESLVVVVTEDCEIDKDSSSAPVSVAPIFPLALIQDIERRADVKNRRRYPFLPLPDLPGIMPESYADLRCITYINRKLIQSADRHKSMTKPGVFDLQRQIIAFFSRISMEDLAVGNRADAGN